MDAKTTNGCTIAPNNNNKSNHQSKHDTQPDRATTMRSRRKQTPTKTNNHNKGTQGQTTTNGDKHTQPSTLSIKCKQPHANQDMHNARKTTTARNDDWRHAKTSNTKVATSETMADKHPHNMTSNTNKGAHHQSNASSALTRRTTGINRQATTNFEGQERIREHKHKKQDNQCRKERSTTKQDNYRQPNTSNKTNRKQKTKRSPKNIRCPNAPNNNNQTQSPTQMRRESRPCDKQHQATTSKHKQRQTTARKGMKRRATTIGNNNTQQSALGIKC